MGNDVHKFKDDDLTPAQLILYQRFAALITECENSWVTFVGPTQLSFWGEEELYSARQSRCLDQAYHAPTQSSALLINPQAFLVDRECKKEEGKEGRRCHSLLGK